MTLTILSETEYQEYLSESRVVSFLQTQEMAELLTKRGMKTEFVGLKKNGQITVAALLHSLSMTGGLHMEINYGPVTNHPEALPEFYRALKAYVKENGALRLVVKPEQTYQTFDGNGNPLSDEQPQLIRDLTELGYEFDGLQTGYPGGEPTWHYVKDLSGVTPETLMASLSKNGRVVKKAKSFGIKARALTREELPIFKSITEATSNRREYQDKSLEYYQDFYDSFGESAEFVLASINFQDYLTTLEEKREEIEQRIAAIDAELAANPQLKKIQSERRKLSNQLESSTVRAQEATELLAKHGQGDIPLAVSLFIYTPHELVYLFGGSLTEFNKLYAPAVLHEYAMLKGLSLGISFYNFLGIAGRFDGSDGVLRFKKNFNGYVVRKMGTFRYYPSPFKFKFLQWIKKVTGRN